MTPSRRARTCSTRSADAIDDLARALAALGVAYEQLDEHHADELEEMLFGPVQSAYGRARRTHTEFATASRAAGADVRGAGAGRAVDRRQGLRRRGGRRPSATPT